jgi:hypothetical protein
VHEAATAHKSRPRSSQPKTASHTSFGSTTLLLGVVCITYFSIVLGIVVAFLFSFHFHFLPKKSKKK